MYSTKDRNKETEFSKIPAAYLNFEGSFLVCDCLWFIFFFFCFLSYSLFWHQTTINSFKIQIFLLLLLNPTSTWKSNSIQ